ncbi:MAG TPA: hypothetical protein VGB17_15660 [Pyrinomonadaceae bacterium]|jgi:hypothetical protein
MATLKEAIKETREHLEINGDPDVTDEDAFENLMGECGQDSSGYCSMAGSEYCEFECPF